MVSNGMDGMFEHIYEIMQLVWLSDVRASCEMVDCRWDVWIHGTMRHMSITSRIAMRRIFHAYGRTNISASSGRRAVCCPLGAVGA